VDSPREQVCDLAVRTTHGGAQLAVRPGRRASFVRAPTKKKKKEQTNERPFFNGLLNGISRGIRRAVGEEHTLFIYDARPWLNAEANRAGGGGYENTANYEGVELEFAGIGTSLFFFLSSFLSFLFSFFVPTLTVISFPAS